MPNLVDSPFPGYGGTINAYGFPPVDLHGIAAGLLPSYGGSSPPIASQWIVVGDVAQKVKGMADYVPGLRDYASWR